MKHSKPLYVSLPLLPEQSKLNGMIGKIWESKIVTNHGPFHDELESRLKDELKVPTAMLFNNGTSALLTALKIFDFQDKAEVITTPLTFAATAHAISWNGLTPVFADVDPKTLTLDPSAIRKAITPRTQAILPVHTYGSVCDLEAIGNIAKEFGLKVIYDAAHAFGVNVDGVGIGNFGDATVFSFHATKLYNSIEGGAIVTPKSEDAEKIYMLRNFGIKNEEEVVDIGINGKMNELQAAVGILNLELYREEMRKRSEIRQKYDDVVSMFKGIRPQEQQPGISRSEQYYPLVIDRNIFGASRDDIYDALKQLNIFSRKYFHPICTDFTPYKDFKIYSEYSIPVIDRLKYDLLCLPFHSGVNNDHIDTIRNTFQRFSKK